MTNSTSTGFDTSWRKGLALAFALVCSAGLLASCGGGSSSGSAAPQALAPAAMQPADPDTGNDPPALPASKVARFAYVTNQADNTISIYTVAATGQLRHAGYTQAGTGPQAGAVDAAGKFAYVANSIANTVSAYAINAASGALTPVGSAVAAGTNPYSLSRSPGGTRLYGSTFDSNNVTVIDTTTNQAVSTIATGKAPINLTVLP